MNLNKKAIDKNRTPFMKIKDNVIYLELEKREIAPYRFILQDLNFEKINNQIEAFRNACLRYPTSFSRIENIINSLFTVEFAGQPFSLHFKNFIISKNGEDNPLYFFRIRKLNEKNYFNIDNTNLIVPENIELDEIKKWSDVWERPAHQVTKYQRLSKPKNSVLYTSLMTSTALLETNINQGDLFILITYKSKRKI